MLKLRWAPLLTVFALIQAGTSAVWAQAYPTKPIRILTSEVGGGNDFASRLIGQALTAKFGQPVVIENRPSRIIGELGLKASPDGYTLFVAGSSFALGTLLQQSAYDPIKDYSYITMVARAPNVLVIHPSIAAKTVKELIALAKARPGQINFATGGAGSSAHLAAELFKSMAAIDIVRVNYKGTGPALNDVIANQGVQMIFASASSSTPHIKSGRLRALGVGTPQPSTLLPDIPTIASALPGYESAAIAAMFAPAKTPVTIINQVNREVVAVLRQPDVKERFYNTGTEAVGDAPAHVTATMKAELARIGKVIKEAGIRVE